jgi:hypothetical protein
VALATEGRFSVSGSTDRRKSININWALVPECGFLEPRALDQSFLSGRSPCKGPRLAELRRYPPLLQFGFRNARPSALFCSAELAENNPCLAHNRAWDKQLASAMQFPAVRSASDSLKKRDGVLSGREETSNLRLRDER